MLKENSYKCLVDLEKDRDRVPRSVRMGNEEEISLG